MFVQGMPIAGFIRTMKIDVNRNDDMRYWSERLGVSRAHLAAAIAAAGPKVDDVEAWIRSTRRSPRDPVRQHARRKVAFHSFD